MFYFKEKKKKELPWNAPGKRTCGFLQMTVYPQSIKKREKRRREVTKDTYWSRLKILTEKKK